MQQPGQVDQRGQVTGVGRLPVRRARRLRLVPVQEIAQLNQCPDVARVSSLTVKRRDHRRCLPCCRRVSLESLGGLTLQLGEGLPVLRVARQPGQRARPAVAVLKPEDQAQEPLAGRLATGPRCLPAAEGVRVSHLDGRHDERHGLRGQEGPHPALLSPMRNPVGTDNQAYRGSERGVARDTPPPAIRVTSGASQQIEQPGGLAFEGAGRIVLVGAATRA